MTRPAITDDVLCVNHSFRITGHLRDCLTLDRGFKDMDWPRRRLADLTSQELHQRAVEYRRMAIAARGQSVASALDKLAIRFALMAARREMEEASQQARGRNQERDQHKSELAKLIALANYATESEPDAIRFLANTIKAIAESDADPYLVMGTLLEGAVHTICSSIPHERRNDTA